MITAKQVRELLQGRPFRPLRMALSDGTHSGLDLDPDGFAEYFARGSILHSTKLEGLSETVAR